MKNILVPIEEHALLRQVLESSLLLGQEFDSYVEGIAITFAAQVAVSLDVAIPPVLPSDHPSRRETAVAYQHQFETFMTGRAVPRSSTGSAGVSFGWEHVDLKDDSFASSYAGSFDVTVVGRPST